MTNTRAAVPLALLIGLQVLDVVLHAATGQVEAIRVTSNAIVFVGTVAALLATDQASALIRVSALLYLALNLAFLVQYGLVNPATGAMRLPLFVFVVGSLILMVWLMQRLSANGRDA